MRRLLSILTVTLVGCSPNPDFYRGGSPYNQNDDEPEDEPEGELSQDEVGYQEETGWAYEPTLVIRDGRVNGQAMGTGLTLSTLTTAGQYGVASIWVEENQDREFFLYQTPPAGFPSPAPLLVVFHAYGVTHADVRDHTDFLREAAARGWYVLAPLGRWGGTPSTNGTMNFGALPSQHSTRTALEWMLLDPAVDPARVFGVGFSMGGGAALSFAARHPGTFSALVNHTGGVALMDTYWSDPQAALDLVAIHGADPVQDPFAYQRTSSIELDMNAALVPAPVGRHMAFNLRNTPVRTYYSLNDTSPPAAYLIPQCSQLDGYLAGSGNHQLVTVNGPSGPGTNNGHTWDALNYTAVCDWLDQQPPLPAPATQDRVLVDRSGTFGLIEIVQDGVGFSDVAYGSFPATNHLAVVEVDAASVRLDATQFGLDTSSAMAVATVFMDTSNGVDLVLDGVPVMPFDVRRGPGFATPGSTPAWSWAAGTLTLFESRPGPVQWEIHAP